MSIAGTYLKQLRVEQGLSLAGLVGRMRDRAEELRSRFESAGYDDPPSSTTIGRIENGDIANPSPVALRALAVALDRDSELLVRLFQEQSPETLRVACAHTILGAAVFGALPEMVLDNVTMAHLLETTDAGHFPLFNSLAPNGKRKIIFPSLPDEEVNEESFHDAFPLGGPNRALSTNTLGMGWSQFCLGRDLKELWASRQIDVVIASRDIFESELRSSFTGPMAALACANLTRSVRGVTLLTLIHPRLAMKHAEDVSSSLEHQMKIWKQNPHAMAAFSRSMADICDLRYEARTYNSSGTPEDRVEYCIDPQRQIEIFYPAKTFGEQHAQKFCESVSRLHPWGAPVPREMTLSANPIETCRLLKDYLEKNLRGRSGLITLAVWEPFTSYIRYAWDRLVEKEEAAFYAEMCSVSNAQSPDYWCSTELSLGRFLGSIGVHELPTASMDVLVRRSLTSERNLKRNPKLASVIEFLRALSLSSHELRDRGLAFAREFDTQNVAAEATDASTSANFRGLAGANDPHVRNLSQALRMPRWRVMRALSQLDLSLRFDRGFLELFIPTD